MEDGGKPQMWAANPNFWAQVRVLPGADIATPKPHCAPKIAIAALSGGSHGNARRTGFPDWTRQKPWRPLVLNTATIERPDD